MSYISTQINRFCSAFCDSTFWAEILVIIPLSLLGIWWPVLFEWSGYQSYFMPAVWFWPWLVSHHIHTTQSST
jgi:hypothetical protein